MKGIIFVLTAMSTIAVFAQERRISPNQRIVHFLSKPGLAESIGLPAEKVEKIKKQLEPLQAEQMKLVEELRGKIRENYQAASDILTKPDADPAKLIERAEETGRMQAHLAVLDIKKLVVIRDNLTPEQIKALLAKIKDMPPSNKGGKKDQRRQLSSPGGDQDRSDQQRPNGPRVKGRPEGEQPPPPNGHQPNDPQ